MFPLQNKKILKQQSFSTIELLVSISMILILTGMFLLNYRFQGASRELVDANHIILQKIRETQNLATSSSKLPSGCGTGTPQSYGIYFNENDDFFDIFADKDGEDDYDLTGGDCTCDGVTPTNECIARIFLPATIQISDIKINAGLLDESSPASGWVNFLVKDLSVKMNGENKANIEVETCIKSDCLTNTKKVFINSKGMTEIED